MSTLSVCIIAKDEEKNIERCLKSIKEIADEIIVVDTGSIDNTKNIAKRFTDKVLDYSWDNDFSKARNISIKEATKDWILYLDCDESIDSSLVNIIREAIENDYYIGYYLKLMNVIDNQLYQGAYILRLIKNNKGFNFKGKIHEQILPSIYKKYTSEMITNLECPIYHYGYDLTEEEFNIKNKRNLDILLSYDDDEKDGFYYFNLANQYFSSKDFEDAIYFYNKSLNSKEEDAIGYKVYIPSNLILSYYSIGLFESAIERCNELLKIFPKYKDLYLLLGACYRELGENEESRENFKYYLKLSEYISPYPDNNYSSLNNMKDIITSLN